ncbi:Rab3 GTPase-activating protein non-catalytic subunit isoform B [Glycine soja]|uniref:Rab3 GTPase-activating protein non-catalytic subunit isoform B n=1 Tax=Glycine soja TaxID=3848 RepID=A0A445KDQ8_GLYSO|nr:Rab3 GTPase-activating protein non-catalytic subunit isoform B [Glycine soja]
MRRTGRAGSGEAPLAGGDPSAPLRHRHALSPPRQPLHHPPPLLVLRLHRRCTAAPQDPTRPLPHRCRVHLRPRVARLPRPPRHRRRHLLRLPPPLLPPRGTDSPPGVIARFDGSDIQNMLQKWFEEANSRFSDQNPKSQDSEDFENTDVKIPYQLWNIGKYGTCADAAITGIMPPPLMEQQQSNQRYYCAVAVGEDAVISAYRLSENKGRSLVGAILSKVVPATFSTISSFSKLIWRNERSSPKKSDLKPRPFARASPLTCLKDHPRKGEKLTLSPSGTLAAITDSLGRILLLDTQALVVVRLWKGYRDASCLFMEMLVNKDIASSSSSYSEPLKSDYCLCLAIHAPRKGIIEIWQMRTGQRLRTISCTKGSKMLQPSYRFGASVSSPYVPLEVFLLNGDSGQISVLNRTLDS